MDTKKILGIIMWVIVLVALIFGAVTLQAAGGIGFWMTLAAAFVAILGLATSSNGGKFLSE